MHSPVSCSRCAPLAAIVVLRRSRSCALQVNMPHHAQQRRGGAAGNAATRRHYLETVPAPHRAMSHRIAQSVRTMLPSTAAEAEATYWSDGGEVLEHWDMSAPAVEQRTQASDQLRDTYQMLFEIQERTEDPEWWKRQFREAAVEIKDFFAGPASSSSRGRMGRAGAQPPHEVTVWAEGEKHTYATRHDGGSSRGEQAVLLGRHEDCDIVLPDRAGTSRLAAVLFILPGERRLVVVDPGSLMGISTLDREDSGDGSTLHHSLPQDRRALVFGLDEPVRLQLGGSDVLINPKLCIACADYPREWRFRCGHATYCRQCVRTVRDMSSSMVCPLCRHEEEQATVGSQAMAQPVHDRAAVASYLRPRHS